jgi:glutamate formiminotransferase / 5-formyltetrahydrofolate cyclo-ligase
MVTPMTAPVLLAVPNVSEGRDPAAVAAIAAAFTAGGAANLLDVHADPDHHRAVVTLAGHPGSLAQALVGGAREAVGRIDIGGGRAGGGEAGRGRGARCDDGGHRRDEREREDRPAQHPHVGAVDVVPVVYLDAAMRGAACAEALVAGHLIAERLGVPVFLYGELADGRTRASLRRGGREGLGRRMAAGELRPDFGPPRMHPTAGAALVGAREPLVAFNLQLAPPATVQDARAIASLIREGGAEGLPGVRAIGVQLHGAGSGGGAGAGGGDDGGGDGGGGGERTAAQVSTNVERPREVALADVVAAVRRHAGVTRAELVGLAPRAALEGFPGDLPMPGFDPVRHLIENALGL